MAETFKRSKDKNVLPLFCSSYKIFVFNIYMIYSSHVSCKDDQEMSHRRKIQKVWKKKYFRVSTLLNDVETFKHFVKFAVLLY